MRYSDLKAMWGRTCFTLLIAKIALAIFELTEFICFFHVICGSIYSKKFHCFFIIPDCYLANNFVVYCNVEINFEVTVLWTKYIPVCLFYIKGSFICTQPII